MALDPDIRSQLFKTVRLWALALVCASVGAAVVWRTNDVNVGILAFVTALAVFGVPLWAYERSRRAREQRDSRRTQKGRANGRRRQSSNRPH